MTRSVLSFLLCAGVIALALCTAFVQVQNCRRAQRLASMQRELEMIEAGVEQLEARAESWRLPEPVESEVPAAEVGA